MTHADPVASPEAGGLSFRTEAAPAARERAGSAPGLAAAAAGLVLVGMLPFGSTGRSPAAMLTIYWVLLLAWAALAGGLGQAWSRAPALRAPAGLFAAVLAIGLLQLTPWLPGGANPVWALVPKAWPAVTLDRSATVLELVKLVGLGAAFAIGLNLGADARRSGDFVRGLGWVALALGAFALAVFTFSPGIYLGVHHESGPARLASPFLAADGMAAALSTLSLFSAAAVFAALQNDGGSKASSTGRKRLLSWDVIVPAIGLVLCSLDLYLTAARSGLAAALLAGLALLGTSTYRAARRRVGPTALILLGLCVVILMTSLAVGLQPALERARADSESGLLLHRIARLGQDAVERLAIYDTHIHAALLKPWFGYGLGTWPAINALNLTPDNTELLWRVRTAHNLYLQWIEEAGLVGALLMAAAIGLILLRVVRAALTTTRKRLTLDAVAATAVLLFAEGMVDDSLQQPANAFLFAVVLGLGWAVAGRSGSARRQRS